MHALGAWEESPLLVEPVEKAVMLADTQQQVEVPSASSGPWPCSALFLEGAELCCPNYAEDYLSGLCCEEPALLLCHSGCIRF